MEKIKFLFISLYYSTQEWNSLKTNFIGPIVKEIQLRFQGAAPIIHVSMNRGENIGITIPVTQTNGPEIAEFIDGQAKSFFHLHPCKRNRKRSRPITFFKDFPVNSIQYNLHSFPFKPGDDPEDELLLAQFNMVSQLILDILIDEDFNVESLFTFSFYLHLLLIQAMSENMIPAGSLIDNYSPEKIEYKQAFDVNKDTLYEITESILNDEIYLLKDNTWMKDWLQTSVKCLEIDSLRSPNQNPLTFYKKISAGINKQLGLNIASEEMLSAFIRYCVEKKRDMILDK